MGFLDKTLKKLKTKVGDKEKEEEKKSSLVNVASKDDVKREEAKNAKSRNQEIKKSRNQEIKKSRNQEIEKESARMSKEEVKKDAKKDSVKKEEKKKEIKEDTKNAYKVLIKPLVSEKAAEAGKLNQYIFIVSAKANKQEIKKAINVVYGIKPIRVNVINMRGKTVRFGRTYGKRKDFKKAIVTLPKGKSIQIYEGT